ncbi:MAG: response regulator, partial [Candidatus Hydrogenedentes bacterium]|nr:response regulator [Candidatus Hydrogenedentota bacterium]
MQKTNVLVVDDEEDLLSLLDYNLSRAGYAVTCVASGGEAIRATRAAAPDLVILDLMLPGLDGLEVCTLLKNDPKTRHIPIVMLTAKGEESDIVRGLEMGADDY